MSPNLVALLYLVAGVLFIQALRGLSSPDSSRRGNYLGMIGMTIAVLTTLGSHPPESAPARGLVVGMAAVLVAAGAFYAPAAFDIGTVGHIHGASLIEMSLGVAIGAVTFTGSVIALLKLSGRMSGK